MHEKGMCSEYMEMVGILKWQARSDVRSERDDSMQICSAVRYSGDEDSAANRGRLSEMMDSWRRTVRRSRWSGANRGVFVVAVVSSSLG